MDEIEEKFNELTSNISSYAPAMDLTRINRAYEFARLAHGEEKRFSGDFTINHSLNTAILLSQWKMDESTIIAGLLHDTVEHGAAKQKDIYENFGDVISQIVGGVTNVSQVRLKGSTNEIFVENLRKMFLAMAKDLRVVFIRLAERIDNLKTLKYLSAENQKIYARESLEIYAPLADRLGMWKVKSEIDDLAFKYALPMEYEKVVSISLPFYRNAEVRIHKMKVKLLTILKENNLIGEVYGRKKGYYSLYNKLRRSDVNWDVSLIHDIVALRILVNDEKDCYVALSLLLRSYRRLPNIPIADFIASPKPNGYRSIHLKIIGEGGFITDLQIRTYQMHEEAEFGVASHWHMSSLKAQGKLNSSDINEGAWTTPQDKLSWVKELADWQKEIHDSEEFLEAVKFDALSKRIFVFSPKGDVYDLPEGSTPVDFAYAVHTKLAEFIKAARVDNKMVPLNYRLKNGQVIEILKHKDIVVPNGDWLNFVVTTTAKREIQKGLRKK